MVWQLWNGPDREAITLSVGSDTTRGLVTSGVVELLMPHQLPDLAALPPAQRGRDQPAPAGRREAGGRRGGLDQRRAA